MGAQVKVGVLMIMKFLIFIVLPNACVLSTIIQESGMDPGGDRLPNVSKELEFYSSIDY